MDCFTQQKRSHIMSSVRTSDTQLEKTVRRELWANGFRSAYTSLGLPGTPDVVLPKYRAVLFVNGCFWHGHDCKKGSLPRSNREFWQTKIAKNRLRDQRATKALRSMGWRCFNLWGCQLQRDCLRVMRALDRSENAAPIRRPSN